MTADFRFGVNMMTLPSAERWRAEARRAEEMGFDVLHVPDHLGMPAPFAALVAAAEVTSRVRLGTYVLNAGLWNPAMLAREVATCDRLTSGRLELGLGAGYVKDEHDQAGLPFGSPGERVTHLERCVAEVTRLLADPEHHPQPAQRPHPPLLIGGNGDRVLRLAARHAHVAAFAGGRQAPGQPPGAMELIGAEELEARVAAFRRFTAEERGEDVEQPDLNWIVQRVVVTEDREGAVEEVLREAPYLDEKQLLDGHPALLIGTVREIAEQLLRHRERYGFRYVTVLDPWRDAFAPVIAELRGA